MVDYHSLIARAVAGLEKNTTETRRALYDRARNALAAQSRRPDAPLTDVEIAPQRRALEDAIQKFEAEVSRQSHTDGVLPNPVSTEVTGGLERRAERFTPGPPPRTTPAEGRRGEASSDATQSDGRAQRTSAAGQPRAATDGADARCSTGDRAPRNGGRRAADLVAEDADRHSATDRIQPRIPDQARREGPPVPEGERPTLQSTLRTRIAATVSFVTAGLRLATERLSAGSVHIFEASQEVASKQLRIQPGQGRPEQGQAVAIRLTRGRQILFVGVLAAIIATVVFTVGRGRANFGKSETYITTAVKRGGISSTIKATGVVNAALMVEVGSQLSGQISEVLANFNDAVKAGQVIARVDPSPYIAVVNGAKADLKIAMATAQQQKAALQRAKVMAEDARAGHKIAETDLAAARVKQDEAERDVQRNTALAKTAAISDREYTQSRATRDAGAANVRGLEAQLTRKAEAIEIAEAEILMAEANVESAQAVVEQKEAALAQAEVNFKFTEIRSPIDGIVLKRSINPGQTVAVSLESKTLFKITDDMREMEVHGKIDEADIGQVKMGQPATFTVDTYPDRVFSGRVLQVRESPEVSQSVVTYTAVISASNPDHLLFPGMTARLRIVVQQTSDKLKLPNAALQFRPHDQRSSESGEPGSAVVWVERSQGEATPIPVTLGKSDELETELLSGNLAEGDDVVVGIAPGTERDAGSGLR